VVPQQPIGDASMSQPMPQQDPMMNGTLDPHMNADPNAMPQDPSMQDPNMIGNDMEQPNMGGGNIERDKKNIQKNIGKACADFRSYQGQDKDELGKWIEGMLDSLDGDSDDENVDFNDNPENMENPDEQMPMEGVFTKGELNALNEVFGDMSDSEKEEPKQNEKKKQNVKKSPFNNPKFN
jgi:hypothetical protein